MNKILKHYRLSEATLTQVEKIKAKLAPGTTNTGVLEKAIDELYKKISKK